MPHRSREGRFQTGKELPPNELKFPSDPVGENWDEDDLDQMFPKLTKKFA